MGRLIDADKLIDYLGFDNTEEEREENVAEIVTLDDFDEQPTAYDVDKVVEQLKELKMRYFLTIANTGDKDKDYVYENITNTIDKAIEIVKSGGVE
mgnify:CR=1 FL=1